MHCILLLPDAAGRMPTAQELRRRGFAVSEAVERPEVCLATRGAPAGQGQHPSLAEAGGQAPGLALAAEDLAPYGEPRPPKL